MSPDRPFIPLASIFASLGLLVGTWVSRLPALSSRLQMSESDIGLAIFCAGVGALLAVPFVPRLIHRFSAPVIIMSAGLAFAATLAGIGSAPSFSALSACLFLLGVSSTLFDVAINAVAVEAERRRGRAMLSRLHGFFSVGLALGAAAGAAGEAFGIGIPVHYAAAGFLIAAVNVATFRQLPQSAPPPAPGPAGPLVSRMFLLFAFIGMSAFLSEGIAVDWAALLIAREREAGGTAGAIGLAVFAATMTGSRFLGDWITERIGRRSLVLVAGVIASAGLLLTALAPTIALTYAGLALAGTGLAPLFPSIVGLAADTSDRPNEAIARIAGLSYVAILIGPSAGGYIAEHHGIYLSFAICAGLLAAASALVLGLPGHRGYGAQGDHQ